MSKTTNNCSSFIFYFCTIKCSIWKEEEFSECSVKTLPQFSTSSKQSSLPCHFDRPLLCIFFTFCFLPLCNCLSQIKNGPSILLNTFGPLFSMQFYTCYTQHQYSHDFLFTFSWDDSGPITSWSIKWTNSACKLPFLFAKMSGITTTH